MDDNTKEVLLAFITMLGTIGASWLGVIIRNKLRSRSKRSDTSDSHPLN